MDEDSRGGCTIGDAGGGRTAISGIEDAATDLLDRGAGGGCTAISVIGDEPCSILAGAGGG